MIRVLLSAIFALALLAGGEAVAQSQVQPFYSLSPSNNTNMQGVNIRRGLPVGAIVVTTCGTPPATYTAGQAYALTMDTTGTLCTAGGSGGTTAVNITQVGGAPIALGQTTMSGSFPVVIASDQAVSVTQATIPWTVGMPATADIDFGVTSAQSTAAGSNLVIKAAEGNLYQITATIGATAGYLMLFNATSLPANGPVSPLYCVPVDSNGTNGFFAAEFNPPKAFSTGITAGFSTTGCFTLTASATASFFAGYK